MTDQTNKLEFLEPEYDKKGPYELEFNPKNIRKLTKKGFDRLKSKVLRNVYEPLKIWKKNNIVLSGNQRLAVIRSLIEEDGYDIPYVNVAIYDVDDKTAKFIELADNEHDGEYDLDKLLEEIEEIEQYDLKDILNPQMLKKIEKRIENDDLDDIVDSKFDDNNVIELDTKDLIITNVPKREAILYHDLIDEISKKTGIKNEWKVLKTILKAFDSEIDKDDLIKHM